MSKKTTGTDGGVYKLHVFGETDTLRINKTWKKEKKKEKKIFSYRSAD